MNIQFEGIRSPIRPCTPTAQQKADMDVTLTWAIFNQPFFAHLLLAELPIIYTEDVPIAATDGFCLFINPTTFFRYELQERAFILFHEVMHCVLGDCVLHQAWYTAGTLVVENEQLPYIGELMNVAQDFVINALLISGGAGRYNSDWLYDRKITADGNASAVIIYRDLYKKAVAMLKKQGQSQPGLSKPGQGKPSQSGIPIPMPDFGGQKRFDEHLAPGAKDAEDPADVIKHRSDAKWKAAVQSAATVAQQQGKLPASIQRVVFEVLNPKVSWQDHLRSSVSRATGAEGLDWRYADKRMITRDYVGHDPVYFARASGHSAGTIVIGVDTSGSIGQHQLDQFFGEMTGILNDMSPERVVVIQCDAEVGAVDEITDLTELDEWRAKGLKGGGGTAFEPVFERVAELGLQPDAIVYLTDLYGSFPGKAPEYPVIWGVIGECRRVPFGDIVPIEI